MNVPGKIGEQGMIIIKGGNVTFIDIKKVYLGYSFSIWGYIVSNIAPKVIEWPENMRAYFLGFPSILRLHLFVIFPYLLTV